MKKEERDIGIRYTDEQYVSQRGLGRILGTSLGGYHWNCVLNYRKEFQNYLPLRDINNAPIYSVKTPAILERIHSFENKLRELNQKAEELSHDETLSSQVRKEAVFISLHSAVIIDSKKISDLTLKAMINGMYREENPDHDSILGYLAFLRRFLSGERFETNDEFFADTLMGLWNTEELLEFYRTTDSRSRYAMNTSDATYRECPSKIIESKMESLLAFLRDSGEEVVVTALVGLYFILYLKPFPSNNELIACLLAKNILSAFGTASALLPIEKILEPSTGLNDACYEVQTTQDFTYFLSYALPFLEKGVDNCLDAFSKVLSATLREEKYRLTESDVAPSPKQPEPKQEEPKQVSPAPTVEEIHAPPKENPISAEDLGRAAVAAPPRALNEKEIKETARYILQTNPNIRKPQALFYAAHCTIGCYYTIQDYKRATRCVYETARTSMDNLAKEGYYEKRQVKNKFVYTPIKQGDIAK
ncbi:MAG: hypothetical protein SOV58_03920 [Candidatus Enteromonas sp.]|nr:hypothetical protein [Candidatus Enteromonas sp.]